MNISTHLGRLLAIFLIAGLVLAPLSAPANAAMVASTATADMPCCPDKSAPMDCDQCPLMAICLVKTFQQPSATGVVEIRPVTVRMLMPRSDPQGESLGQPPPPRPPRLPVRSA